MKVVIVGGVAGGATAAARIRRLNEQAEIVVFERSGYISYANCGLPYYIGDVITDRSDLTLQTPESFFSRFHVNMKVRHEVTAIHPEKKEVTVKNLETGEEFEESYDKLILSPGAKPTQPRLPGVGLDKLFTLRTVEDTFCIKDYINANHPKSAVLAGGGFIGLELAENLRELGMDVTIVQRPKQLMNPFDADMASFIHNEMRKHGVKLALGHTVEGFEEKDGGVDVLLKDEQPLHADMVILAIGVSPETTLAKDAGLELGIKGSIVVNDRMETSISDIYAVGDAVQVKHFVTGQDALISLAGPANKQGRIAADNICGGDSHYTGSQGSSVIKIFGMTAATTGVNETNARKTGLDVDTVILSPMSHAGYYPGGKVMTMKVVFEKATYRLLGAQIVGYEGVDKHIDVLATAIRAGMKATALKDLDLHCLRYGRNGILHRLHQFLDRRFQLTEQRIVCLDLAVDFTAVRDNTLFLQRTGNYALVNGGLLGQAPICMAAVVDTFIVSVSLQIAVSHVCPRLAPLNKLFLAVPTLCNGILSAELGAFRMLVGSFISVLIRFG